MDPVTLGLVIAAGAAVFGGLMTWVAYVSKQMSEHSRWMAVTAEKLGTVEETLDVHDRILRPIPPNPWNVYS